MFYCLVEITLAVKWGAIMEEMWNVEFLFFHGVVCLYWGASCFSSRRKGEPKHFDRFTHSWNAEILLIQNAVHIRSMMRSRRRRVSFKLSWSISLSLFVKRLVVEMLIHHCICAMRRNYGENMKGKGGGQKRERWRTRGIYRQWTEVIVILYCCILKRVEVFICLMNYFEVYAYLFVFILKNI